MWFWIWIVASFLITAFGQPAWFSGFGVIAGCCGFALFWRAMLEWPRMRDRFWLAVIWFGCVQGVQLSWMTSTLYMGPLILFVYLVLLLGLGIQFGVLSLFVAPGRSVNFLLCLAAAGCWALFEWIRLFVLTGFTWNPVGLALASSVQSLQLAAIWGVYGLSFWVILVNLAALRAFFLEKTKKSLYLWAALAIFPYLFGSLYEPWVERKSLCEETLSVALVQTGLLPEQKEFQKGQESAFVPALRQWQRIFDHLKSHGQKIDLIVLPEAAFPLGAYQDVYPLAEIKQIWRESFGADSWGNFPVLQPPFASSTQVRGRVFWNGNNTFLAQALANHFQADVIVGLDDRDLEKDLKYNAVFHFHPEGLSPARSEKRVLVPVSEYVPFPQWAFLSLFLQEQFGIGDSFDPGIEAKIFETPLPLGVSICIEEIYSHLVRDLRLKGAELLITISNDVWFPSSRLPIQHFHHGRVRAAENGVYIIRSSNTGITGGIDCFGRALARLEPSEKEGSVLYLALPLHSHKTLYTWWGDYAILAISLSALLFLLFQRKKKLP